MEFSDFYGFLPLTRGLVELVEKVVALAFLVQMLGLLLKKRVHVSPATALTTAGATCAINQPVTKMHNTLRTYGYFRTRLEMYEMNATYQCGNPIPRKS